MNLLLTRADDIITVTFYSRGIKKHTVTAIKTKMPG